MAKLTLTDLTQLSSNETSAVAEINANGALIETAMENTLSRDGTTPNTMSADIDLNSNDLLNVGNVGATSLTLGSTTFSEDGIQSTYQEEGSTVSTSATFNVVGSLATMSDVGGVATLTIADPNHDALTGFVANEHIDHTSVTLTAGDGLSGGGDISANRSFAVDISGLTADGAPVGSTDYVMTYDDSAGVNKKVLLDNLAHTATVITQDEGIEVDADATTLDFVGAGVVATDAGSGVTTVTIAGSSAPEGTAVLSTGEVGGSKFLREDGDGTSSWQAIPGGGDALTSSPLSQFAATSSAQLAGVMSDETGSGGLVFATSPTLVTPALGTPASGVLTNATGLPVAGLAGGTDGELITWDASGNAATVAVGTSGHVLTSNGAGAAPTFQAGGGGGSGEWTYNSTVTLSADTDTIFDLSALGVDSGEQLKLVYDGISCSVDDSSLQALISYNDQVSFETTLYEYLSHGAASTAAVVNGSGSTSSLFITHAGGGEKMSNAANHVMDGETVFYGLVESRWLKGVSRTDYNWAVSGAGLLSENLASGVHQSTSSATDIKVQSSSGNFSGKIHVYIRTNA